MNALFRTGLVLALALLAAKSVRRADGQSPQEADASKQRLARMQQVIDGFQVASPRIKNRQALQFAPAPLLRYADQTRNLLDAGVWRLGQSGRPTALATLETYLRNDKEHTGCEVVSLHTLPFTLDATGQKTWELTGTELKMRELIDAAPPAASERARLTQMRQFARRYAVHEMLGNDKIECRLMPQPIDRYVDRENKIVDGAAFAFANGTNPEAGVLLETDGATWQYGAFRLSTAAVFIELDGKLVAEFPKVVNAALPGPYIARVLPQPVVE